MVNSWSNSYVPGLVLALFHSLTVVPSIRLSARSLRRNQKVITHLDNLTEKPSNIPESFNHGEGVEIIHTRVQVAGHWQVD